MRPLKSLPDSPTSQKIKYELFTKNNKNSYDEIHLNKQLPSNFKTSRDTIFMVHGFISSPSDNGWQVKMKNEFLNNNYDYNIILIDWSKGANVGTFNLDYPKAAQNTRVVGDVTGQLIDYLSTQGNKNSHVHCIGHSLGAHICGYAGKMVKNGKLKRISGLDPAGPYFENEASYIRLDKNDASYVDSIHTDGKALYEAGFGMLQAISHDDYYPNKGYDQPGCRTIALGCSHGRSCEYYIDSIHKKSCSAHACSSESNWSGGKCNSCNPCNDMGFHSTKKSAKFYLDTSSKSPWC